MNLGPAFCQVAQSNENSHSAGFVRGEQIMSCSTVQRPPNLVPKKYHYFLDSVKSKSFLSIVSTLGNAMARNPEKATRPVMKHGMTAAAFRSPRTPGRGDRPKSEREEKTYCCPPRACGAGNVPQALVHKGKVPLGVFKLACHIIHVPGEATW